MEIGGGRKSRQSGQVRKKAAVTSFLCGSLFGLHPFPTYLEVFAVFGGL